MVRLPFSIFTATLLGFIFIGQLEGLKSSPIPAAFLPESDMTKATFKRENMITVVFLSCAKKGRHEVSIEHQPGKSHCINVDLANGGTEIMSNREEIKFHVFEKKSCEGVPTLYDPSSSQPIPFTVGSFMVHHEHDGMKQY